jgi:hypothetical protein
MLSTTEGWILLSFFQLSLLNSPSVDAISILLPLSSWAQFAPSGSIAAAGATKTAAARGFQVFCR